MPYHCVPWWASAAGWCVSVGFCVSVGVCFSAGFCVVLVAVFPFANASIEFVVHFEIDHGINGQQDFAVVQNSIRHSIQALLDTGGQTIPQPVAHSSHSVAFTGSKFTVDVFHNLFVFGGTFPKQFAMLTLHFHTSFHMSRTCAENKTMHTTGQCHHKYTLGQTHSRRRHRKNKHSRNKHSRNKYSRSKQVEVNTVEIYAVEINTVEHG